MQIIISPAKKMRIDNDDLVSAAEPRFLKDTEVLLAELRKIQYDDLKKLWQCNDEIAALNYKRLQTMRLRANLTPAVLAYDGIQYQYMAPRVFENAQLDYVAEHLNILLRIICILNFKELSVCIIGNSLIFRLFFIIHTFNKRSVKNPNILA